MDKKYMRMIRGSPHNIQKLIKVRLNSPTIQGDLYKMV